MNIEDLTGKIHHADCLELMREIPDKSIDLVLTDPPYGINFDYYSGGRGTTLAKSIDYGKESWNKKKPDIKYFNEMFRISKNQIIWGGNYFVEYLKNSTCWLVWDKNNTGNFADCELAWTSYNSAVRLFKYTWNGMIQERMGKDKIKRIHPTEKPVDLFIWCLQNYSNENDIILDCFSGSGTTAIACHKLKKKFICIEKEQKYVELSRRRLEETQAQLSLF